MVPTGEYLITKTISTNNNGPMQVVGDGESSNILWAFDGDLFVWANPNPIEWTTISSFTITSIQQDKSPSSTALRFSAGFTKGLIDSILMYGSGPVPVNGGSSTTLGSGIDLGKVSDTLTIRDTTLWFLSGTGVKVGMGSEVRIEGGRIIGVEGKVSIGVWVTGNNGGVHLVGTDVISHKIGMQLDNSNGQGSNREIFLSQATLDSNWRGLAVQDDSYVSFTGVWAASSDQDNIWVSGSSTGALLSLTGGTIFNAGSEGGDCGNGMCNGLVVNAGSFMMTGVAVRYNKGVGIWVPNDSVGSYTISGCQVFNNGVGANLGGSNMVVVGNVFNNNGNNLEVTNPSSGVIQNNVGA